MFIDDVQNASATLGQEKKELSEYKSIYMTKNYYLLFYEGLQKGIHELLKVLLRLFYLLEKTDENLTVTKRKQSLIS